MNFGLYSFIATIEDFEYTDEYGDTTTDAHVNIYLGNVLLYSELVGWRIVRYSNEELMADAIDNFAKKLKKLFDGSNNEGESTD